MDGSTEVLVVGGGATGVGVARDLSMRGVGTTLVERGRLADGATGHTHGVLHSGARYAVDDPASAADCIEENRILRDVAPHCVEATGGYFLQLSDDSDGYFEEKLAACRDCGVPAEPVSGEAVRGDEPSVSAAVERGIRVPDAAVDSFALAVANAVDARERGAAVETRAEVVDLRTEGGRVTGAEVRRAEGTDVETVEADHVVNAAGAWAGAVGALAGVEVRMRPSKGAMVVADCDGVDAVLNRCRPTSDGDIVVPRKTTAVLGTTSEPVADPDDYPRNEREAELMVEECARMVPGLATSRVVRSYWGVRPLYDPREDDVDGREVTRGYSVLDHGERDGLAGLTTVVGGKLTTYRLMAEAVADRVCDELGVDEGCRTDAEPLPEVGATEAVEEFGPRPPAADR